MHKFTPYLVLKMIWIVPCADWMLRLLENLCLTFDDSIFSYYASATVAAKKEKSEMSFKSSIRQSCPISEITNSYVCRLKRLETRVIKK